MKRRLLAFALMVLMLLSIAPMQALAADALTSGTVDDHGITYTLKSGTLTVSGSGECTAAWISAFDADAVKKLVVKNGVTGIGIYAFQNCAALEEVSLPSSLKYISGYGFFNCTSLKSIALPEGLTALGMGAFYYCTALEKASLPDSLAVMEGYAFYGCSSLKSISIPSGLTMIDSGAFCGCSSLESISLPNNIKSVYDGAFLRCTKLGVINLPDGLTAIGADAFAGTAYFNASDNWVDDALYIGKYLIASKSDISGAYSAKAGTELIACGAFSGCNELTEISLPSSLRIIGSDAFSECIKLSSISIPDSVSFIGINAFFDTEYYNDSNNWEEGLLYLCNRLIAASSEAGSAPVIKDGTKSIEDSVFSYNHSIRSITLPSSLERISDKAFCDSGVEDVYYGATAKQWSMIDIAKFNEPLLCATLHCSDKALEPFPDVPVHEYYFYPVQWALASGMTTGSDNGNFDPEGVCTRGQIVTLLWRAAGEPIVDIDTEFTDVPEGKYYYDAVRWAVSQGITNGIGNGLFDPESACTRAQVVTFLHRAAGTPVPTKNVTFPDVKYGEFYYTPVAWAAENGITVGSDNGLFDHNSTCTRNQVMTFMYRARDYIM